MFGSWNLNDNWTDLREIPALSKIHRFFVDGGSWIYLNEKFLSGFCNHILLMISITVLSDGPGLC